MTDPNLTRRGFLQGLAALTGVGYLDRFRHLEIPGQEVEEAPPAQVEQPALLDTPITAEDPLCWLEVNGERYPLVNAMIDIVRDPSVLSLTKTVFGPTHWEMYVEAAGDRYPADVMLSRKEQEFSLYFQQGDGYTGRGYIQNMDSTFEFGEPSWTATIVGNGALTRVIA